MKKERIIGLTTLGLFIAFLWMSYLNYDGLESLSIYQGEQKSIEEDYQNRFFYDEEILIERSNWIIQVAAFENIEESMSLARQLEKLGSNTYITKRQISDKVIYRVRVFGKNSEIRSDTKVSELKQMGFSPTLIRDGYDL